MADPKNTKPSGDSPSLSTDLLSAVAMNLMSQAEGQMTEAEEMQAAGKSKEAWRACTAARCLRLASRAVREVADNVPHERRREQPET